MEKPSTDDACQDSARIAADDPPPLTPAQFALFSRLAGGLPPRWIATRRRRRFLFLMLAAPGFFAVFATPLHRNFFLTLAGFLLFGAAIAFRLRTEPLFVTADAANLWPSPDASTPNPKDSRHA